MENTSNHQLVPENTNQIEEEMVFEIKVSETSVSPEIPENHVEQATTEKTETATQEITEEVSEQAPGSNFSIEQLSSRMEELNQKFDEKLANDAHKNALFDKMYKELSDYKNDIYQKIMKPIIMDIIMVLDDTNKIIRDIDKTDAEKVFKVLNGVPDDLLDILERNGIEAYQDNSDVFNPKTQRVLKIIQTSDTDLDNQVESRVRKGYRWDDKVIKPEMINCYKYIQKEN